MYQNSIWWMLYTFPWRSDVCSSSDSDPYIIFFAVNMIYSRCYGGALRRNKWNKNQILFGRQFTSICNQYWHNWIRVSIYIYYLIYSSCCVFYLENGWTTNSFETWSANQTLCSCRASSLARSKSLQSRSDICQGAK